MVEVQGKGSSSNVAPAGLENAFSEELSKSQTHYTPNEPQSLTCPECGSTHIDKNGHRYVAGEIDIQRYLCKKCRYRFSEKPPNDYKDSPTIRNRQLCAILQGAKKLTNTQETETCAGDTNLKLSDEGQILQYLIYLKNQGYRDSTIEQKDWLLRRLLNLGANLNDPETVKHAIASLETSESYKALLSIAYEGFAKRNGITWTRPNYEQNSPLPFVPHESEIDALIAGCGKKMAALLLFLKETAMRLGEAWMVEWTDLDPENRSVVCNHPEKNSKARMFQLSPQLVEMLQGLQKLNQYIFNCGVKTQFGREDLKTHKCNLRRQKALLTHQRRRVAEKLKNTRILKIHYHTFRHYKATQLYHQTRDILYVMKFLGHRDVKNTLIYIDLEIACYSKGGDEYHAKTARTEIEALQLIEAGFEYVCDMGEVKIFRKRR